jgi:hypothetical protein
MTKVYVNYAMMSFCRILDGRMASIGLASRRDLRACKMEVKDGSRSITSQDRDRADHRGL